MSAAAAPVCGGRPAASGGPLASSGGGLQGRSRPAGLCAVLSAFPAGSAFCVGRPGLLLPGGLCPRALGRFALSPAHGGPVKKASRCLRPLRFQRFWCPLAPSALGGAPRLRTPVLLRRGFRLNLAPWAPALRASIMQVARVLTPSAHNGAEASQERGDAAAANKGRGPGNRASRELQPARTAWHRARRGPMLCFPARGGGGGAGRTCLRRPPPPGSSKGRPPSSLSTRDCSRRLGPSRP